MAFQFAEPEDATPLKTKPAMRHDFEPVQAIFLSNFLFHEDPSHQLCNSLEKEPAV
jgi:hypothetical protein